MLQIKPAELELGKPYTDCYQLIADRELASKIASWPVTLKYLVTLKYPVILKLREKLTA